MLLAGVYTVAGVQDASEHDRVLAARILGIFISTLIVGLIGVVAAQLWGRRVALAAMGLAAVYIPLIVVGGAVMSEPLFAALLLGRARRGDPVPDARATAGAGCCSRACSPA